MTSGCAWTSRSIGPRTPETGRFSPTFSPETLFKPALSGLIILTGPQPRVVLRTNPGLSKNVPSGHGLDGCRSHEESRLSPGRVVGRAMVFGCPSQRLPADEHPVHPAENHRMTNSHNHPPQPFPEGEIFHSPGLTRSGYPGWGTSIMTVEPQRGSLDVRVRLDEP